MSRPERRRSRQFTQGPTTVEIGNDGIRIASRGATIAFTTMEDFTEFINELGILSVFIGQALPDPNPGNPGNTDEEENPT